MLFWEQLQTVLLISGETLLNNVGSLQTLQIRAHHLALAGLPHLNAGRGEGNHVYWMKLLDLRGSEAGDRCLAAHRVPDQRKVAEAAVL